MSVEDFVIKIEVYASVSVYGDNLDKDQITTLLKLEPDDSCNKGEWYENKYGKNKRKSTTGRWSISSKGVVDSISLEEHIAYLLDKIESSGVIPAELPNVEWCRVFCYYYSNKGHGGPAFSAELLGRMARLKLPLDLDFYS